MTTNSTWAALRNPVGLLLALFLIPVDLFAWTNGELLIWMDADRGQALKAIAAKKFENDFVLKVTIEAPEKITDSFPIAAQMAKGPDIVIWAHDKVGEWADAGLIAPVQISEEFGNRFFSKAWQAVLHNGRIWGYPIALETVTLIYNKKLLDGSPPTQLSDLVSLNEKIKKEHPGVTTILWDYNSSYYSWGVLASAGAYVFAKNGSDYDLKNMGVGNRGAVEGLSKIIALIHAGVLPKSVSYGEVEDLIGQGKVAMIVSGPWAWLAEKDSTESAFLAVLFGFNLLSEFQRAVDPALKTYKQPATLRFEVFTCGA